MTLNYKNRKNVEKSDLFILLSQIELKGLYDLAEELRSIIYELSMKEYSSSFETLDLCYYVDRDEKKAINKIIDTYSNLLTSQNKEFA